MKAIHVTTFLNKFQLQGDSVGDVTGCTCRFDKMRQITNVYNLTPTCLSKVRKISGQPPLLADVDQIFLLVAEDASLSFHTSHKKLKTRALC